MPRVALLLLFSCFHALRGTSPRALELQHPAVPEPRGVLVGARKPAEDEAGGESACPPSVEGLLGDSMDHVTQLKAEIAELQSGQ